MHGFSLHQNHLISLYTLSLPYHTMMQVIDGFETLDAIEKVPVTGNKHRPLTDVKIESVIIHANPLAG